tara:strand:+ start:3979 stop:4152 length:174 start_codon:yes stop_codon:yes gene_type:complete
MKPIEVNSELNELKKNVNTSPVKGGGASFKTNVLIEESSSKLYYKPSIGVGLFSLYS